MSYLWDVFISYRRVPLIQTWTRQLFVPTLRNWLPQFYASPQIFLDVDEDPTLSGLAPGAPWAPGLETALKQSRCLIPILSAEYADSDWCMTEFNTMLARQQSTGAKLILPVRFADGTFYPPEASALQLVDFERFNTYRRKADVSQAFTKGVINVCKDLRNKIGAAPQWRNDWTIATNPAVTDTHVPKPTF